MKVRVERVEGLPQPVGVAGRRGDRVPGGAQPVEPGAGRPAAGVRRPMSSIRAPQHVLGGRTDRQRRVPGDQLPLDQPVEQRVAVLGATQPDRRVGDQVAGRAGDRRRRPAAPPPPGRAAPEAGPVAAPYGRAGRGAAASIGGHQRRTAGSAPIRSAYALSAQDSNHTQRRRVSAVAGAHPGGLRRLRVEGDPAAGRRNPAQT